MTNPKHNEVKLLLIRTIEQSSNADVQMKLRCYELYAMLTIRGRMTDLHPGSQSFGRFIGVVVLCRRRCVEFPVPPAKTKEAASNLIYCLSCKSASNLSQH